MALNTDYFEFNPKAENSGLEVLNALDNMARQWDNDFSGENGDDFLWDDAREDGFENNADYVYDYIKHSIEDGYYNKYTTIGTYHSNIVEDYLDMWMGHDSYYLNYEYVYPRDDCFVIAWNDESYC